MGSKVTTFTQEQLNAYQESTFFTRKEILRCFERYRKLAPNLIPTDMTSHESMRLKIPMNIIEAMPELKENPFNQRICKVFSDDGTGDMTFIDFLDMFSVFSVAAPRDIKIVYAFRIYDFDGDEVLGKEDLAQTVIALTKGELTEEEVRFVVNKVLEEVDLDDDGSLSYIEFEHVISRAPGFQKTFHLRM